MSNVVPQTELAYIRPNPYKFKYQSRKTIERGFQKKRKKKTENYKKINDAVRKFKAKLNWKRPKNFFQ